MAGLGDRKRGRQRDRLLSTSRPQIERPSTKGIGRACVLTAPRLPQHRNSPLVAMIH